MTKPLILLLHERVLPAGQLVNRLQDLGYRVQSMADPAVLVDRSELEKPLLVMVDLELRRSEVSPGVARLRQNPATAHIPVIAYLAATGPEVLAEARAAGATLVVSDAAILLHLEQFLEQALQVE